MRYSLYLLGGYCLLFIKSLILCLDSAIAFFVLVCLRKLFNVGMKQKGCIFPPCSLFGFFFWGGIIPTCLEWVIVSLSCACIRDAVHSLLYSSLTLSFVSLPLHLSHHLSPKTLLSLSLTITHHLTTSQPHTPSLTLPLFPSNRLGQPQR